MQVRTLSKGPNHIELEISDVDFGILDSLQDLLNKYSEVEYAGASIEHPLYNKIKFVIKTKQDADAGQVLERGLNELAENARRLRERLEELLGKV